MGFNNGKLTRVFLILCIICLFVSRDSGFVIAQNTAARQGTSAEEDARWGEDISQKMDKAIKILNVIKEEVDESVKKDAARGTSQGKGAQAESELGKEVKEKTSLAVRIWRKIRKVLSPEEKAPSGETEEDWTEGMEERVDKIVKVGEKAHKILSEFTTQEQEATAAEGEASWAESMKSKIDKTIKVLEAVREEIDEEEKTESAAKKQPVNNK